MLRLIDSCQNKVCIDQYHLTGSGVYPSRSSIFWSYPLTTFEVIAGSSIFFLKIHMKYVVFMSLWPRTIKMLISNWPRTRKFSQSSFYATDWSKFDRWVHAEIYTASWNLFTLTAEADRVLCQLVMFLTVFFHWMYKMKYSCYQEFSVIHGWFVYWIFCWEMSLDKVSFRFRMESFRFSPCWLRKRVE